MNDKIKNIVSVIVFALLFVTISAACIFTPDKEYSNSERRELSKFPKASAESVFSGDFSSQFDSYTTDQFPKREAFRTIKAALSQFALKKLDNNGLYSVKGHISKIDAKENEAMLNHAAERFTYIYNTYLNNNKVYLSIVPDKNFVLAKSNGYPSLDYTKFIKKMRSKVDFMEYIDVTHLLSEDDYYTTDTHWRQENIVDISRHLLTSMKTDINGGKYTENTLSTPFYGVYCGQYALPVKPDTIKYLTGGGIDNAVVTYYGKGVPEEGDMYNMEKATGRDPYEMFLSGTMPLVTIENPNSDSEKELILFRDSYGSSIAPLFLSGYKKVTLIDTRYVKSEFLGNLVDFKDSDVLFLYSTSLLNNSLSIG